MKLSALSAVVLVLMLSACGSGHQSVKATDRIEQAALRATQNAPQAQAIKFDDEHLPKVGAATTDTATADTTPATTATNTPTDTPADTIESTPQSTEPAGDNTQSPNPTN